MRFHFLIAIAFLAGQCANCHADLLQNGSFETNSGNGSTPANWTLITNSYGAFDGLNELPSGGLFVLHPGANYQAGGRYQDVTTVVNQEYTLTFWGTGFSAGNSTQSGIVQVGTPGTLNTSLSLNNMHEYVNASWVVPKHFSVSDWVEFSYTFTALTTVTRVSFQNIFTGPGQNAINVDLVSLNPTVSAVPEPSSLAILSIGLIGLATWQRIRKALTASRFG